jgi:hypothetical protein
MQGSGAAAAARGREMRGRELVDWEEGGSRGQGPRGPATGKPKSWCGAWEEWAAHGESGQPCPQDKPVTA